MIINVHRHRLASWVALCTLIFMPIWQGSVVAEALGWRHAKPIEGDPSINPPNPWAKTAFTGWDTLKALHKKRRWISLPASFIWHELFVNVSESGISVTFEGMLRTWGLYKNCTPEVCPLLSEGSGIATKLVVHFGNLLQSWNPS